MPRFSSNEVLTIDKIKDDEFTHERVAISIARKLKRINLIDVLSDPFNSPLCANLHSIRRRS
jgi:hypothetical protein